MTNRRAAMSTRLRAVALLAVAFACSYIFACSYTLRAPPSAPVDPRERQRAEALACSKGTLPPWLDDSAMQAALDLDRREASASAQNDAFHGATFTPQPPASARPNVRTSALLEERTEFQRRCEASKKQPRG